MNITLLDSLPGELDAIAIDSPEATFYQTRPWLESLAATLDSFELRCFVAEADGVMLGYLPFFFKRTGPFLRAWSLPFGTYGGPVARGRREVSSQLMNAYLDLLGQRRVLEAGWVDFNAPPGSGADSGNPSVTHVVSLEGGFDVVWEERFASDRRKRARRAGRLGVTVHESNDPADLLEHYRIYSHRVRSFGTQAPHPLELFQELKSRGGEAVRLFVARHEGEVVGGHFNFYHGRDVIAWYGMTSESGDRLQAGTLLYSEVIRGACEDGYASYNFGGSLGRRSLIEYKESLGGVRHEYTTRVQRSRLGAAGAWAVRTARRR